MAHRSLEDSSGGPTGVFLHPADAVVIGYAAVDKTARNKGVRCLAIKGPVPSAHGLRSPSASLDVDALVAPRDVLALTQGLEAWGWRIQETGAAGRLLPAHSTTFAHSSWPITIDLHHRFPGFFAEPDAVFEALWAERRTLKIAGVNVLATGRLGSSLIAALHALRDPDRPQSRTELEEAVAAWAGDDAHSRSALGRMASITGAVESGRPFLSALNIAPDTPPPDPSLLEEWRVRTQYGSVRGLGWMRQLRDAPVAKWPAISWRALMTDDVPTLRRHGMRADGSRRRRAQLRRLASISADVPHLLRVILWDRPLRRLRHEKVGRDSGA